MKTRFSTAIMFGLLAFLFGMIFASGLSAQDAKADTTKAEIVLADQHIVLPADTVEILKLESQIKINRLTEELLLLRQVREKYQIRLDSLNVKVKRSKTQ